MWIAKFSFPIWIVKIKVGWVGYPFGGGSEKEADNIRQLQKSREGFSFSGSWHFVKCKLILGLGSGARRAPAAAVEREIR